MSFLKYVKKTSFCVGALFDVYALAWHKSAGLCRNVFCYRRLYTPEERLTYELFHCYVLLEPFIELFTVGCMAGVLINSAKGAEESTVAYCITETPKLNNLNPYYYCHFSYELAKL